MLSEFAYEWDGTKYKYYRNISYVLIDEQFMRIVYLFWDRLGRGAKLLCKFSEEKNFRNIIFVRKKI